MVIPNKFINMPFMIINKINIENISINVSKLYIHKLFFKILFGFNFLIKPDYYLILFLSVSFALKWFFYWFFILTWPNFFYWTFENCNFIKKKKYTDITFTLRISPIFLYNAFNMFLGILQSEMSFRVFIFTGIIMVNLLSIFIQLK